MRPASPRSWAHCCTHLSIPKLPPLNCGSKAYLVKLHLPLLFFVNEAMAAPYFGPHPVPLNSRNENPGRKLIRFAPYFVIPAQAGIQAAPR